jgi:hypothetical protein
MRPCPPTDSRAVTPRSEGRATGDGMQSRAWSRMPRHQASRRALTWFPARQTWLPARRRPFPVRHRRCLVRRGRAGGFPGASQTPRSGQNRTPPRSQRGTMRSRQLWKRLSLRLIRPFAVQWNAVEHPSLRLYGTNTSSNNLICKRIVPPRMRLAHWPRLSSSVLSNETPTHDVS